MTWQNAAARFGEPCLRRHDGRGPPWLGAGRRDLPWTPYAAAQPRPTNSGRSADAIPVPVPVPRSPSRTRRARSWAGSSKPGDCGIPEARIGLRESVQLPRHRTLRPRPRLHPRTRTRRWRRPL